MKNLLMSLAGLALIACSKEAVVQQFEEPGLMETWGTACASADPIEASTRSFLNFSGDSFTEVITYYSDAQCTAEAAEATYTGTFLLPEGSVPEVQGKPINLKYEEASIIAHNEAGKTLVDTIAGPCGISNIAIGQKADVTVNTDEEACLMRRTPGAVYETYRLEGDKQLLLGNAGMGARARSAAERPTELDSENPYLVETQKSL